MGPFLVCVLTSFPYSLYIPASALFNKCRHSERQILDNDIKKRLTRWVNYTVYFLVWPQYNTWNAISSIMVLWLESLPSSGTILLLPIEFQCSCRENESVPRYWHGPSLSKKWPPHKYTRLLNWILTVVHYWSVLISVMLIRSVSAAILRLTQFVCSSNLETKIFRLTFAQMVQFCCTRDISFVSTFCFLSADLHLQRGGFYFQFLWHRSKFLRWKKCF